MYEVIREFRDKYTKETYKVGRILDLDEERAEEILKKGVFIRKVPAKAKRSKKAAKSE